MKEDIKDKGYSKRYKIFQIKKKTQNTKNSNQRYKMEAVNSKK